MPESIAECELVEFYRNIKVARDGNIAVVSVFRPEVKNALNGPTMTELDAAFKELAADDTVRGVVLTSFDGSLAGADIMELAALRTAEQARDKARDGQVVLDRISAMDKPVVAALDGPVLGGGAELSMACHARVVGPSLMLGQPEVNLGIIPGYGGTQRLPRSDRFRAGSRRCCERAGRWGQSRPASGAGPPASRRGRSSRKRPRRLIHGT